MERKVYLMANKVTDEPLEKLLRHMYTCDSNCAHTNDPRYNEGFRAAIRLVALVLRIELDEEDV
jgi:hypothetical protein